MISHVVALKLAPDAARAELDAVMDGLGDLVSELNGVLLFHHGAEIAAEPLARGHDYGLVLQFVDRAALDEYAADSTHKALGARLVALCAGGIDGLTVFDFETQERDA